MANPIDNGPRVSTGNVPARPRVHGGGAPAAPTVANGNGGAEAASASASSEAVQSSRLQQVQERIDSTPEVDMDRVAAIKQAIADGNFPLDPQRIAQKFVELEGLLNG